MACLQGQGLQHSSAPRCRGHGYLKWCGLAGLEPTARRSETSNRTLKMSHHRGGGAELSTSLSLSRAACGSSGKGSPPAMQDTPVGTGRRLACPGDWLWPASSGDTSQKCCWEHMRLLRSYQEKQETNLCVPVCNICYFR